MFLGKIGKTENKKLKANKTGGTDDFLADSAEFDIWGIAILSPLFVVFLWQNALKIQQLVLVVKGQRLVTEFVQTFYHLLHCIIALI